MTRVRQIFEIPGSPLGFSPGSPELQNYVAFKSVDMSL